MDRKLSLITAAAIVAVVAVGAIGFRAWDQERAVRREWALLYAGDQLRQAIGTYYERSPAGAPEFPQRLADLLSDTRSGATRAYLDKIPDDPMLGNTDWGVVLDRGRIVGVYSRSEEQPVGLDEAMPRRYRDFAGAARFADWKFVFHPQPDSSAANITSSPRGAVDGASSTWAQAQASADQSAAIERVATRTQEEADRAQRAHVCDVVESNGLNHCAMIAARKGEAARSQCVASIAARKSACLSGQGAPAPDWRNWQ